MRLYPTRPAIHRMVEIHRAVEAGTYPNARQIARTIEVSTRTVLRDIEYMRDMLGAPIEYHAVKHGYYYAKPGYSLPQVTLTEGELVSIFVAGKVLQQYAGTPFAGDLRRALERITVLLPEEVCVGLGELADATSFAVSAPRPAEVDLFRTLTDGVRRRRALRIVYASLSRGRTTERTVDPYRLVCVDGAWYLVAYCHRHRDVRLFVPERIRSVKATGKTFEAPRGFDLREYMRGSFRVMRGGRPQRVRLLFRGLSARLVAERRWHPTQKLTPRGEDCVLEMTLSNLEEVAHWVMSFGAECRVLMPADLRRRVVAGHLGGIRTQGKRA